MFQIEKLEQKEREEDPDDPEQGPDVGTIDVIEDDRNRHRRPDEPECLSEAVCPRFVREPEVYGCDLLSL
jgi:hypothetical protein